jgi:2-polyprenyl-3-methyl-5-hydroxy-6-metoxy-1,4-benzoquinol methylase
VDEPDVDPVEVVRLGYDALSWLYRTDDAPPGQYGPWIAELIQRTPARGRVLDVGCGCGVPVARDLAAAGLQVTGVDLSDVQVRRARTLVPTARFEQGDVTTMSWPAGSFDTVVALYSLIHVPLHAQPGLLTTLATSLVDGGTLLLVAGARAWTGSEHDWLGGASEMWWSHADTSTYRTWLTDAGFAITQEEFVPEVSSGHSLFWALRRRR